MLELEDYLSIEDNEQIVFIISLAIGTMSKTYKDYKIVIDGLIKLVEKHRKIGNYTNDINFHEAVLYKVCLR